MELHASIEAMSRLTARWFILPAPISAEAGQWDEPRILAFFSALENTYQDALPGPLQERGLIGRVVCREIGTDHFEVLEGGAVLVALAILFRACHNLLQTTPELLEEDEEARASHRMALQSLLGGFDPSTLTRRARIESLDPDLNGWLRALYFLDIPKSDTSDRSKALAAVEQHLRKAPPARASALITHLLTRTELLLLTTQSDDAARRLARFFSGGRKTGAAPTLLSTLLSHAAPSQAATIQKSIQAMEKTLEPLGAQGAHFLADVVNARYASAMIPEDGAILWLNSEEGYAHVAPDPVAFAGRLCVYAERYVRFVNATNARTEMHPYPDLTYIGYAGTHDFVQHLPLLLALDDRLLEDGKSFTCLVRNLESIVFMHAVSGLSPRARPEMYQNWILPIRGAQSYEQLRGFVRDALGMEVVRNQTAFRAGFLSLTLVSMEPDRILYLFARIENHLRLQASLPPVPIDKYHHLVSDDILAAQPGILPMGFDSYDEYTRAAQQIGNRTYLEPTLPLEPVRESVFEVKRDVYAQSKVFLTSRLTALYSRFTAEEVADRQRRLYEFACEIWTVAK